jgi:6-phosphofructokinase
MHTHPARRIFFALGRSLEFALFSFHPDRDDRRNRAVFLPSRAKHMSDSPRLAILVGGGPAPGINGVISAATIEARNRGMTVIGVQDGYKWLVKGDIKHVRELDIDQVVRIYDKGGSILGTSRTNPAKVIEELGRDRMPEVMECFARLGITHLVSIGGDDTAFSANKLYRQSGGKLRVAHLPKTIDNDIPLPGGTPTFGFETARHKGAAVAKALAEDAKTTSRWYIVVSMGRAAGHLALGIGKAAAVHLTIIPEEFDVREKKQPHDGRVHFREIIDIIMGTMLKRRAVGKEYGIVVLAEGLIESIGGKWLKESMHELAQALNYNSIEHYGSIELDKEHNYLRLGEIEFGRMVKDALNVHGTEFAIKTTYIDKELGYELRCADPIPFDIEYTRNLGYSAVKYLLSSRPEDRDGAIISFDEGRMLPMRFSEVFKDRDRLETRKVDVKGESFEVGLHYMYRLEKSDFENTVALKAIAECAGKTEKEIRDHFGYLVGLGPSPWA